MLTVTLNAAVDKTYTVPGFSLNRVHRPTEFRAVAGGKGVNVARVYQELGGKVIATGFLGGHNGEFIADGLRSSGIADAFVRTRGESRVCIAVIDPDAKTQTEVNENGPDISPDETDLLVQRFAELLPHVEMVAFSGSLPPGCPADIYAKLIGMAREHGVITALDSSGEPLRLGWKAGPDIVKCNQFELRALVDNPDGSLEKIAKLALSLTNDRTGEAIVTLGARGAIAASGGRAWFAPAPAVPFVSAVGSGDAFLAAYLWAKKQGDDVPSCLAWGTAAGAANAAVYGAGLCRKPEIFRLRELVHPVSIEAEW
ncbi:MAG: 1-phosphofructokinase family hexose kinase [Armatimonadota bacterium]